MKAPLTKTTIIRGKKEKEREKNTDKFTTIGGFSLNYYRKFNIPFAKTNLGNSKAFQTSTAYNI